MTADFGLVADAAEAEAVELLAHSAGDRASQAGFADSGRSDEAEDRLADAAFGLELADGQVLQDAVFYFFQAEVVFVKDAGDFVDVEVVQAGFRPGQTDQPVDVGAGDSDFGAAGAHALQAVKLAGGLTLCILGHFHFSDLGAKLLDFGAAIAPLPQLFLDGLDLLAQVVLALSFVDLGGDVVLQLAAELQHLRLAAKEVEERGHASRKVARGEDFLLFGGGDRHVRGDEIGHLRGIVDLRGESGKLVGHVGRKLDDSLKDVGNLAAQMPQPQASALRC